MTPITLGNKEEQLELPRDSHTTLQQYLKNCHKYLFHALVARPASTTQENFTSPIGKFIPILAEWKSFREDQAVALDYLKDYSQKDRCPRFPSQIETEHMGKCLKRSFVLDEKGTELFIQLSLHDPVMDILDIVSEEADVREKFNLNTLSRFRTSMTPVGQSIAPSTPKPGGKAKTPTNRPDFYLVKVKEETDLGEPYLIIECKPPFNLRLEHLRERLREFDIYNEIIHSSKLFTHSISEKAIAAVLCQAYTYMIQEGLEYGYIATETAIIFLRVPEDPGVTLLYHLVDVTQEVNNDGLDEMVWHTAVAQTLVFALCACNTTPRSHGWRRGVRDKVKKWKEDDELTQNNMTPSPAQRSAPHSTHVPSGRFVADRQSPIRTRNNAKALSTKQSQPSPKQTTSSTSTCGGDIAYQYHRDRSSSPDPDDYDGSPTRKKQKSNAYPPMIPQSHNTLTGSQTSRQSQSKNDRNTPVNNSQTLFPILDCLQNRPYCTQRCLFSLLHGERLDPLCPNTPYHCANSTSTHHALSPSSFRQLLRTQLASDLDTNCVPLGLDGARGALFKLTLASHGYTVVAKGTVPPCVPLLRHEALVYRHLAALQSVDVPVCLGNIDLVHPYYYHAGVEIVHMLLMAWGGLSLADQRVEHHAREAIMETAMKKIQEKGVVHRDFRPANMLWCEETGGVMVIDFEQSIILPRWKNSKGGKKRKAPLGDIDNPGQGSNRKKGDGELEHKNVRNGAESFCRGENLIVEGLE
ncbi:hypothetical protein MMC30_007364 [Trapelia coarctata]|nr:hypothetical protein [Trapelia coarctata]